MSADEPAESVPDEAPTKVQEAAGDVERAHEEPTAEEPGRGRRWAVRIILTLAVIVGIVATLAVWVNRQALNAQNWANTSSSLLENKDIREAVAGYVVDEVYANVQVGDELKTLLPGDLKDLSGPAAGALRGPAQDGVEFLLQQPFVQRVWKAANKAAMQQAINVIEERDQGLVKSEQGKVVISLRPIVQEAVDRLGLPANLANQIPADAGTFTVFQSDDLAAVQSYGKALKGLAVVLPILSFLLFLLAVFLARGRRRRTLMIVGIDLIVIGVIVLVARTVADRQAVDALASTDSVRPAVEAALVIATKMLKEIAWSLVLTGIPVIVAAVLAGPTKPARATRKYLAPWLRDQRPIVYGVLGVVVLIVILWEPVPWTGQPLPMLLAIVLLVIGVELLQRQTRREFPGAETSDASEAIKALGARFRGQVQKGGTAVSEAVSARREASAAKSAARAADAEAAAAAQAAAEAPTAVVPAAEAPTAVVPAEDPVIAQLERLAALHEKGVLTDEELAAQKSRVLGGA
jgi:hypothetical protein